jgi:uncharacterized membrane protein YciS (DUF1049 family)
MIQTGLAFLLFTLLAWVFELTICISALVTGLVWVALGLLLGERPFRKV